MIHDILLLEAGAQPPGVYATYRALNEKYIDFVNRLQNQELTLEGFVRQVAYNLPAFETA